MNVHIDLYVFFFASTIYKLHKPLRIFNQTCAGFETNITTYMKRYAYAYRRVRFYGFLPDLQIP